MTNDNHPITPPPERQPTFAELLMPIPKAPVESRTSGNYPITPPPGLRQLWAQQAQRMDPHDPVAWQEHVATQAARWGADQELEACVEWVINTRAYDMSPGALRATRRPKPPSLKEQALEAAQRFYANGHHDCSDDEIKGDFDIIRRALESLPD